MLSAERDCAGCWIVDDHIGQSRQIGNDIGQQLAGVTNHNDSARFGKAGKGFDQSDCFEEHLLFLEQATTDFQCTRTGHFDHHLSTTFEQVTCFAFEMLLEKGQRGLIILIH